MYTIKLLDNKEYDALPVKRAKTSLGCADTKTKTAWIRKTGVDLFDLGTIQHEIDELVAKVSPHEEDGIRYKGDEAPEQQMPAAPKYKTADDLYTAGINWAKQNYPEAYGARESALSDIENPDYYSKFQPTSFESALGNSYFSNIMPDIERSINQQASLRGLEGTVVPMEAIAKQRASLGTTIGEYLSNLGNTRASNSLSARLGINPGSIYSPYTSTDTSQSNTQTGSDYQYALMKAQLDYQNAMNDYQQKQAGISSMLGAGGAGIGALLALPTGGMSVLGGAALGSSIGGYASPLFGGSSGGGMDLGTALSLIKSTSAPQVASSSGMGWGLGF